jgi:PPOX class probable F420-dependent enzyme
MTTPTLARATIPASHIDLLARPIAAVLTTLGPDGQPQSSLVWADYDAESGCAQVNTTLERQKGRNMAVDRRVSLLVVDPDNTARYLQVRGDAELVRDGAIDHLDRLTRAYTRHPCFYVYPEARRLAETRVICRIRAQRVTTDAVHA